MTTYSFRGFGVARADYTLDGDSLVVTLPGTQLGKRFHEGRVPLAQLRGFFVEGAPRQASARARAVAGAANQAIGMVGKLVVVWTEGARQHQRGYTMVNVGDPAFTKLVDELARRNPGADLRRLPIAEAKQRLGMRSDRKTAIIAIVVVVLAVIALGAIRQLTR